MKFEGPTRENRSFRLRAALAGLSSIQREIIIAALTGDDECLDGEIADRHGMSAAAVRLERILARRHLNESLPKRPLQES